MTLHNQQVFADAQAAFPFVVAQGRNIETRIYEKRYPAFDYASHIPVVTEGNPWAIGTTFQTIDTTGSAKFISGAASDMPKQSATRDQASHDFAMIGAGWDWNLEEINQAALYGINLSDIKAMSATNSLERLLYDIAMTGSTEKGWTGFCNNGVVARADVANDGTSTSTFWSAKTVDLICRDINGGLSSVRTATKEVEWADSLRLPPDAFRDIATRRLGTGDGTQTLLDYIRKNNIYTAETGQPLNIAPMRALRTASQDGGGRMVVYRKDPDVIRFHLPMPRRGTPVWQNGVMSYEQAVIARTGGVEIRLPGAMAYLDEITAVPSP